MDGEHLRFARAESRGDFPADFRVDVYAAPKGTALTPLDPLLAPESHVALLFLAAVPKQRRDLVIDLTPAEIPEHEMCWNGSCDLQPGRETRCSNNDEDPECQDSERECSGSECQASVELETPGLPDDLKDIVGFSVGHVVLYVRDALAPQEWAALRVGAPDGLSASYHLAELREPDEASLAAASRCEGRARKAALDAYNAQRETALDVQTMRCFFGEETTCDLQAIPTGDDAKELAEHAARAEAEARCSLMAVDMAPVAAEHETITIRIGEAAPVWRAMRPSTPSVRPMPDNP
jgi:hypothetical protein